MVRRMPAWVRLHQRAGGGRGQVGGLVGLGDDDQAASDGGGLRAAVGERGQVGGHGLLAGRQRLEAPCSSQKLRKSRQPAA